MGIYLSVFIVAYLFFLIADKQRSSIVRFFFMFIAVLIPSLLAGFRDETVGTDLLVYAVQCFERTQNLNDLTDLSDFMLKTELEPAYVVYTYLITRFTDEFFWFLFIQMIICLGLVAFTCNRLRKLIHAPLLYFVFLLFCFCPAMSYNRQIFATCVIFFGYYYLLEKSLLKFIICICIAQLFHNSAIFAIFLYPLYLYAINLKRNVNPLMWIIVIATGLALVYNFPSIISFFLRHGMINEKYIRYMNADYNTHKIDLIFITCLFFLSFINKRLPVHNNIIKAFSITIITLLLCGIYNDIATRVALYYELFLYINILLTEKEAVRQRRLLPSLLLLGLFIVFTYCCLVTTYIEAIPYTSRILGIK